jgi:hypothetical protein
MRMKASRVGVNAKQAGQRRRVVASLFLDSSRATVRSQIFRIWDVPWSYVFAAALSAPIAVRDTCLAAARIVMGRT